MTTVSQADLEASISRAKECMLNSTDHADRQYWQRQMLAAIEARNASRTPQQLAELEQRKGLV